MHTFGRTHNPSIYGVNPRARQPQPRVVYPPGGYPRSSGFGVVPVPVSRGYDPIYQAPYGGYPPGVNLIPTGVPLRPYDRLVVGDGIIANSHTHTHLDPWRPDRLAVSQNSSPCGISNTLTYQYDTKDIVVRGKAKVIRQSYLHESPKFEAELVKYLDKKTNEQIPENVVDMLITFINSNEYQSNGMVDEVTLNILAHNVGCKSVVDVSLSNLKKNLDFKTVQELGEVTAMILMCSKVDSGLKAWLKKTLEKNNNQYTEYLLTDAGFLRLCEDRPEIGVEFSRMLGLIKEPKDDKYRSL